MNFAGWMVGTEFTGGGEPDKIGSHLAKLPASLNGRTATNIVPAAFLK
jgi:hypothetical protein